MNNEHLNNDKHDSLIQVVMLLGKPTNPVILLRTLMHAPLLQIIKDYFKSTREFESGLEFEQACMRIIQNSAQEICYEEKTDWMIKLISLRLEMFDYLNYFEEYIACFDLYFCEKEYVVKYINPQIEPISNNTNLLTSLTTVEDNTLDSRFGKFLVTKDKEFKYVHFLYLHNRRYEILQRKLERSIKGKCISHLKRHSTDTLSDEEYFERIHIFVDRLEQYVHSREGDPIQHEF